MRVSVIYLLIFFLFSPLAMSREFEVFDGRHYNGLFYPLVDIIEWGEQDGELPHLEFHIHQKDKTLDLAAVSGVKGGKPVLWLMYDLRFRNERVCRHVLAPRHFREGQRLYFYRDNSDPDYDNIYVFSQPWAQKGKKQIPEYQPSVYERCSDENASNMPETESKVVSAPSPASPQLRQPASDEPAKAPPAREGKGVSVDYENAAVPFSF